MHSQWIDIEQNYSELVFDTVYHKSVWKKMLMKKTLQNSSSINKLLIVIKCSLALTGQNIYRLFPNLLIAIFPHMIIDIKSNQVLEIS